MPPAEPGTAGVVVDGDAGAPAATTTGLSPRGAACLSYAAWWVSGAIVLAVEPGNEFVRFHARQALVGFGALWVLGVLLWGSSFVAAFISPGAFKALAVLANVVWAAGVGAWLACMVSAARGRRWVLPWLAWRRLGGSRRAP